MLHWQVHLLARGTVPPRQQLDLLAGAVQLRQPLDLLAGAVQLRLLARGAVLRLLARQCGPKDT